MKIKMELTNKDADVQRKFYEAVRGGMDYDEAFDLIIEKHFDEVFGEIVDNMYAGK
jgi:hypothetical protein